MLATPSLRSRTGWGAAMALVAALACGAAHAGKPSGDGGGPKGGGSTSGSCDGTAANRFAARAYSVHLDSSIAGIDVNLGPIPDTGELPSTGGTGEATLVTVDGVGLPIDLPVGVDLHAGILQNTTMGSGNTAAAASSVLGLQLGVRNGLTTLVGVTADLVSATAKRKCAGGVSSTVAGQTGSDLANLAISILGVPVVIPASAGPNTSVALPSGLGLLASGGITLNEQYVTASGRQVVNAIHITLSVVNLLGGSVASIDLVISHAEAGETCGTGSNPNACNCGVKDFMTGIGFVDLPSGNRINFGIHGGQMADGVKGNLNLVDRSTRQHFKSTTLTGYAGADSGTTTRTLTFACTDGLAYTGNCVVEESDNGEPGGGVDGFRMTPYYDAEGQKITRGNVQLHKPDCGTTTSKGPRK